MSLAREAYETAIELGDWSRAQLAVGEWLLAACAWWDIDDARRLAAASLELAQRCAEPEQAGHYNRVAVLSYVCARYGDAKRDLVRASTIDSLPSPPSVFLNQMMSALIALAELRWNDALEIALQLDKKIDCDLPAQKWSVTALRVEALLSRDAPGDAEDAGAALASMGDRGVTVFPWNIGPEITRACVAARLGLRDADLLLRRAMDAAEERAHEIPFDADRAYAQLEIACRRSGNGSLEARAALRREYYERLRRAAAAETAVSISVPILPNWRSSEAMPRTSS